MLYVNGELYNTISEIKKRSKTCDFFIFRQVLLNIDLYIYLNNTDPNNIIIKKMKFVDNEKDQQLELNNDFILESFKNNFDNFLIELKDNYSYLSKLIINYYMDQIIHSEKTFYNHILNNFNWIKKTFNVDEKIKLYDIFEKLDDIIEETQQKYHYDDIDFFIMNQFKSTMIFEKPWFLLHNNNVYYCYDIFKQISKFFK